MTITFGLTDPGNRKVNEDACYFDSKLGLAIVCDGVSAHGGGDLASAMAIETIKEYVQSKWAVVDACKADCTKDKRSTVANLLSVALSEASKKIFQQAQKNTDTVGMCTTVDVLLLAGSHAVLAHVGSGRCYLLREKTLRALTEDHTQAAELKKKGKGFPPGAEESSLAKKITRAVGHHEQVRVDVLEVELMAGDKFFLCTDGVWATIPSETLPALLSPDKPQLSVQAVMAALKQIQPKDNYTALVCQPALLPAQEKSLSAEAKLKLTRKIPAFRYLSYAELIKVMSISELFKVKTGDFICKEGDPGEEMMVILAGKLSVEIQGKKIAELAVGQTVGEMSLIEGGPRTASLVATENTNLVAFSRKNLFSLLRDEPEISVKFLWGLTEEINRRLRITSSQLAGGTGAPPPVEDITKVTEILPFLFQRE